MVSKSLKENNQIFNSLRQYMGVIGKIIVSLMPFAPKFLVKRIAGRYVAGSELESAIDLMKGMSKE